MYKQLGVATRADARGIAGCLSLLQAWIYGYFLFFRPSMGIGADAVTSEHVAKTGCCVPRFEPDGNQLMHYRRMLDGLTPESVTWLSYGRYVHLEHPRTLYAGCIRYLDLVEPYKPDRTNPLSDQQLRLVLGRSNDHSFPYFYVRVGHAPHVIGCGSWIYEVGPYESLYGQAPLYHLPPDVTDY
ncbi:hypothetical protein RND81_14G185200 [Saponaria officinalis]|uniref:Aminotransferase-like plant mobile domain-containing protein n=1 Tax=Saponaria officinalis TaxID=3572 RepID=A0AAW1GS54_SAPOF